MQRRMSAHSRRPFFLQVRELRASWRRLSEEAEQAEDEEDEQDEEAGGAAAIPMDRAANHSVRRDEISESISPRVYLREYISQSISPRVYLREYISKIGVDIPARLAP
jgi:hypothetical protein